MEARSTKESAPQALRSAHRRGEAARLGPAPNVPRRDLAWLPGGASRIRRRAFQNQSLSLTPTHGAWIADRPGGYAAPCAGVAVADGARQGALAAGTARFASRPAGTAPKAAALVQTSMGHHRCSLFY